MPASVCSTQKVVDDARKAEAKASEAIQEVTRRKLEAMRSLMKSSADDIASLEAEHTDGVKELQRFFREGTSVQYKQHAEATKALSLKLTEMQEDHMVARNTVNALTGENGPLDQAKAALDKGKDVLGEAEMALWKVRRENLIMRSQPVFEFPSYQSVPAIEAPILKELCSLCNKGFVAKAAILRACNCLFHPVSVAEMIKYAPAYLCPTCDITMDPAWIAQWNGKVHETQDPQIEATHRKLKDVREMGLWC